MSMTSPYLLMKSSFSAEDTENVRFLTSLMIASFGRLFILSPGSMIVFPFFFSSWMAIYKPNES